MSVLALGLITLMTSTLTGVFGLGGGLLLLGFMPLFLPVATIIPIHGVTQLASNSSRAWFGREAIAWEVILPYCLGGVFGAACFAMVLNVISLDYLPLFIGGYILLSQWSNVFNRLVAKFEHFTLLGFVQVGLSVLAGTIGPVHMILLNKRYNDKNTVVATAAALMTVKHAFKVVVFVIIGVQLWAYATVMLTLITAAVIGSFFGTQLRGKIEDKHFSVVLKIILTLLAVRMIALVFLVE